MKESKPTLSTLYCHINGQGTVEATPAVLWDEGFWHDAKTNGMNVYSNLIESRDLAETFAAGFPKAVKVNVVTCSTFDRETGEGYTAWRCGIYVSKLTKSTGEVNERGANRIRQFIHHVYGDTK